MTTTLVIKLTDNLFQTGLVIPGKRTMDTIKAFPLYVAYEANHTSFFSDAEKKEHSICLMQPKDVLQQKLDQMKEHVKYTIPSAQQLWCEMMKRMFDREKADGVLVSLPDHLDESLREMILTAVDCIGKMFKKQNDKFEVNITHNSILAARFMPHFAYLAKVSETANKQPGIHILLIIQHGFNETQWDVVVSKDEHAVVLKTGKVDIGMYSIYQEMMKMISKSGKEFGAYETLTNVEKTNIDEEIKRALTFFTRVEMANIKNVEGELVRIKRGDVKEKVSQHMEKIIDEIMKTIAEVNEYLDEVETIQLGEEVIDLSETDKMVEEYIIDTETRNIFLQECMRDRVKGRLQFIETNNVSSIVVQGGAFVGKTFVYRMVEPQQYEEAVVQLGSYGDNCQLDEIMKAIEEADAVEKNYHKLLAMKNAITKERRTLKLFVLHQKEIIAAQNEIFEETDPERMKQRWEAYKVEYSKKYGN